MEDSAEEMAAIQNAEDQKQKQELEGKKLVINPAVTVTTTAKSVDDDKITNDLSNLVEKLQIELQIKDKELAKELEEKQKLSADLELEKAIVDIQASQVGVLKNELASAQQIIEDLQLNLWKSLSSGLCYYIQAKVPSQSGSKNEQYDYLYVDKYGQLHLDDLLLFTSRFKFTKNSNGTFSIYSVNKKKYLQTQTSSNCARVIFSATDEGNAGQFVFGFHPQNQKSGLSVDIRSVAGSFLYVEDNDKNYIVENSSEAPADKFLIVPADEDD